MPDAPARDLRGSVARYAETNRQYLRHRYTTTNREPRVRDAVQGGIYPCPVCHMPVSPVVPVCTRWHDPEDVSLGALAYRGIITWVVE